MNVYVNGRDISKYIETINWSGDENQLARKLTISYLYAPQNPLISNISVPKGSHIRLTDGGDELFNGIVLTEERQENSIKMQNMEYDFAWYLRNKTIGVYKGTPGSVTAQVCSQYGISCGSIYDPGGEVEVISTGEKTISQIISAAYEGQDVHVYMEGQNLCTELYGTELSGTVTGDDYVTNGTYKSSIENIVNRVVILDAAEQPVGEVGNGLEGYGVIQDVYKISGDEADNSLEAAKLLKGIEDSGKITVKGNPKFRTGKSIIVEKVNSKIRGRFVIISDSHAVSDASYMTTLGLRFSEVVKGA